jgi:PhnB protein
MAGSDPQVVPYLFYADAGAALDWLAGTFGFSVRARSERPDGSVRHGELELDQGGLIMVGSPGPGFRGPAARGGATQLIRITVTDLARHRDQSVAHGADASAIGSGAPGWDAYSVTDAEGHEWYFTAPAV